VPLLSLAAVLLAAAGMVACAQGLSSKELQRAADQANKDLPKKTDAETEVTKVEAQQGLLIYNCRLVNAESGQVEASTLTSDVKPRITQAACASQQIKDTFFKNHVTLRYTYHDKNDGLIGSFDVKPADCGM